VSAADATSVRPAGHAAGEGIHAKRAREALLPKFVAEDPRIGGKEMALRARWIRMGVIAGAFSLFVSGCSPSKSDASGKEAMALLAEAQKITAAEAERYADQATDLEYPLYRSLMKAGRLDEALGGP
jgi:hypothetical protein